MLSQCDSAVTRPVGVTAPSCMKPLGAGCQVLVYVCVCVCAPMCAQHCTIIGSIRYPYTQQPLHVSPACTNDYIRLGAKSTKWAEVNIQYALCECVATFQADALDLGNVKVDLGKATKDVAKLGGDLDDTVNDLDVLVRTMTPPWIHHVRVVVRLCAGCLAHAAVCVCVCRVPSPCRCVCVCV